MRVSTPEGTFGGLFWRKGSALRFAKANAGPAGCAVVFPQARFELDLENHGNPLVACLGIVRRLLTRQAKHRLADILDNRCDRSFQRRA